MGKTPKRRQLTTWSDEKVEELCRLWQWTDSTVVIGVLLKMRPNAVAVKASRLGLPRKDPRGEEGRARRSWTAEERKAALHAARIGKPLLETSKELDRSLDALVRKLEELMGKEEVERLILSDTSLVIPPPPPRQGLTPARVAGVSITTSGPQPRPSHPSEAGYRKCPKCSKWRWSREAGDRFCEECKKEIASVYA